MFSSVKILGTLGFERGAAFLLFAGSHFFPTTPCPRREKHLNKAGMVHQNIYANLSKPYHSIRTTCIFRLSTNNTYYEFSLKIAKQGANKGSFVSTAAPCVSERISRKIFGKVTSFIFSRRKNLNSRK